MASKYALTLAPTEKSRYLQKLLLVPCDCPYDIPTSMWTTGFNCSPLMPKMMDTSHMFAYLVETRSDETQQVLAAYKGLSKMSMHAVQDGWIQCFKALKLTSNNILMKAEVYLNVFMLVRLFIKLNITCRLLIHWHCQQLTYYHGWLLDQTDPSYVHTVLVLLGILLISIVNPNHI